ncbi:unnamed protein product [Symbiodinium natans]|uniref:Uncharacterized protein n=1 Tax=Symbiodinium natans TaxID=878477 RepID=A0A812PN31_9DINO|nr:unnamed protein product [Symbiodinium natans]
MSFYKANKKPLLHGKVGLFSRKRNEGPPAEDLAAAHTTRGKKARFSRNCYNIAVLRDEIPGCIRLWKKHKCAFTKQTKSLLYTEPLAIVPADEMKGLLHRILLPQRNFWRFYPQA